MLPIAVLLTTAAVAASVHENPAVQHPGILNITAPPYSIDSSGLTDVTAELQKAIRDAYSLQVPLFFPPGRYLVSDTLLVQQNNYGSSMPVNLRPARFAVNVLLGSSALPERPIVVLRANSSGFGDPSRPKNLMKVTNTGRENDNMNQVVRGIDFELQRGNPGAVALFMHAAQGGTVQDVTVWAADAFAGFGGGGGAGASHTNVAVIGGQHGVFFDESEAGPVVVGSTFLGQTRSALTLQHTQGPLVVVGATIVLAHNATGPAINSPGNFYEANHGVLVLDASIDCNGSAATAVSQGSYLKNVWVRGCEHASGWHVTHESATGPMWRDGHCEINSTVQNHTSSGTAPELSLASQHVGWDEASFPGFERAAADAVKDCGAKGDAEADDTAALQGCIDTHTSVFLPKGIFRISSTLRLRENSSLVGLSQTHSVIAPLSTFTPHAPLLSTPEGVPVTIAFVGLTTFWHLDGVYTLDWRAKGGLWRNNYESRVCECMWLTDYGSANTAHGRHGTWPPTNCTKGVLLTVPKTQIRGSGQFYNYVSDEDILLTDHRGYRHLLVSNNSRSVSERTVFYSLNLEHGQSEANGEFSHSARVDIYGFKKEGSTVSLWIKDSSDINIFYTNSRASIDYTAVQNMSQYPADFPRYTPSLFRVERSTPIKFVGFGGPDGCGRGKPGSDRKCQGRPDCCSYPISQADLVGGHFPQEDWDTIRQSLWQPWCGYIYPGAIMLLEADGVGHELLATTSPGAIYMRGHPITINT